MTKADQRAGSIPSLSIIIPTVDEENALALLLTDLRALTTPHELIVSDGGSADGTLDVARAAGAHVACSARGRGTQLAAGARLARGDMLCFLHADVRLDAKAIAELDRAAGFTMDRAAVFHLRIAAQGIVYRLIELMANHVRTRVLRLPYGDQGLVVSRDMYDAVGGYPALPLMEDVELVRSLRRLAPLRVFDASLLVSARRWERDGPWRRTFRNWAMMLAYSLGMPAERLVRWYRK